MRAFILVCCLTLAYADQLGYNYQPVTHSNAGLSFTPSFDGGLSHGGALLSQSHDAGIPIHLLQHTSTSSAQLQQAPLTAEYQKEFYTYAAPEDDSDDAAANQQISGSIKKSLRVVFIKTPENKALENAALSLAKQAADERTAIYVLSKQTDIGNLAKQLQGLRSQSSNKPEVHFVKYRTPADAINAQQAIQGQYNTLPGASRSSNEGSAPVLNFASRASAQPAVIPAGPGSAYLPAHPLPNQEYLPASLRRYRLY